MTHSTHKAYSYLKVIYVAFFTTTTVVFLFKEKACSLTLDIFTKGFETCTLTV